MLATQEASLQLDALGHEGRRGGGHVHVHPAEQPLEEKRHAVRVAGAAQPQPVNVHAE